MYKLRDYFRDEYHDRLQDKVKKQRMKTLRNAEYQNRRNEQMNKEVCIYNEYCIDCLILFCTLNILL